MKLIRNSIVASVAFASLAIAACSSQHGATGTGSAGNGNPGVASLAGDQGNTGSVGMHLDIAPGTTLTSINWTISNGTNTYTGTVTIGDAQSLEFVAGGILAGSGYTVTLTGADSAGDACTGTSSTFTITAGAVTQTVLAVVCKGASDGAVAADVNTGAVEVDASVTLVNGVPVACPGISSFSISPAEINLSQTAALTLVTTPPSGAAISWSVSPATGGSFGSTSAAITTFACAPGAAFVPQVTVTATVALADSGACQGAPFTTMSALVNCEGAASTPDAGAPPPPDTGAPPPDTGAPPPDTGAPPPDTGSATPTACTSAPCAASGANSVQCPNNTAGNGVCTPTEALIVARDIAQGNLTATGQLKLASGSGASFVQGSCYSCLNFKDCLDGNGGDTGNECGDSPDVSGGATGSGVGQCIATLTCILSTDCQGAGGIAGTSATAAQETVGLCYCGGNNPGSTCLTAGTNTNGLCVTQEATGFGFAFSDNTDIVPNLTSQSFPSGEANEIFGCGASNKCTICQ